MGFRINTNIAALNAHTAAQANNRALNNSLEKLSSGLRINKAADDASGMAIADSLRNQADGLGQAIKNANDGIGIIQTADKAMDEQVKILNTIKTKATQAAQDGQTTDTRKALQKDITKLMQELDNIAGTTSFNGQQLLSGQYTNKEFQIGAYSNTTVKASIGATSSDKIGATRFETGAIVKASNGGAALKDVSMKFISVDGKDVQLESVSISTSAGTGIGVLAETINKNSNATGVRASWQVVGTGEKEIASGVVKGLKINGVTIGDITVQKADSDGALIGAINAVKDKTGVEAYVDEQGRLNLRSLDGRAIDISICMVSKQKVIAQALGLAEGKVSKVLKRNREMDVPTPRARPGRTRKTTDREDRYLLRLCRNGRTKSANTLRSEWLRFTNTPVSRMLVNLRLIRAGYLPGDL